MALSKEEKKRRHNERQKLRNAKVRAANKEANALKKKERATRKKIQDKERLLLACQNEKVTSLRKAIKLARLSEYSVYMMRNNDEELDKQISAIFERKRTMITDLAEEALIDLIKEKKEASVHFALKTLGKQRGYVPTEQHTSAGGTRTLTNLERALIDRLKENFDEEI